jgi:outer membrane protein OmpA-like peptidoglycan-associated protein
MAVEAQDWVTGPATRYVADARTAALATPRARTAQDKAEIAWTNAHNAGGVKYIGTNRLELWNFDVGKATLKPEHIAALKQLLNATVMLVNRSTFNGSFVATGYASRTGGAAENAQLALARAQAVGTWLSDAGFPQDSIITQSNWPGMPAGNSTDPVTLAVNRSVAVERVDPPVPAAPPAPDPNVPPAWTVAILKPGASPSAISVPDSVTLKIPIESPPLIEMPPPPQLQGSVKVSGEIQLGFHSPGEREKFQAALEKGAEGLSLELEGKLADGVKQTLHLGAPTEGESGLIRAGVELGEHTPVKIELQTKPAFIAIEWTFSELDFGEVEVFGTTVTLKFEGKIAGEIGPGPELLERFGITSAEAGGTAAGGVALADVATGVLAALSAAVVMYLVLDIPRSTQRAAVEYGMGLAERSGFAARVTIDVVGGTRDQAESFLQLWNNTPDLNRTSVGAGYNRATQQLQDLRKAGTYDSRIKQLVATYGVDSNGKTDLDFDHVANRILDALGGTSSSAPSPAISAL